MIDFLLTAIKIIFLLGFLILIHEGGHFIVAKLCKVKVNEFAIGFGPTIWRKQGKETKYALRLIPLGGFVSMEGEDRYSEEKGSFSKTSIPKRIAIVLAGGTVNIVFGLLVYFALSGITGNYISQTIEQVNSSEITQLQSGDRILKINDKSIHLNSDIEIALEKTEGAEAKILLERNGENIEVYQKPIENKIRNIGIYFGTQGDELISEIMAIYPESPAEEVGLQTNDKIVEINGESTNDDAYKAAELISNSSGKCNLLIERNGELLKIEVEPQETIIYSLGVTMEGAENNLQNNIYYAFWDTTNFSLSIIENLKMLFTGKVSANQLMGPIGISEVVAETEGISDFVYLLALISLSLGVTNLLPFPPLDGGKVVLLIIEGIRKKPLKENIEIGIQMTGFALIIMLSIYVAYNDVLRVF